MTFFFSLLEKKAADDNNRTKKYNHKCNKHKETASVQFVLNMNQLERCSINITSTQAKKKKEKKNKTDD
jgi:hypothetical protein